MGKQEGGSLATFFGWVGVFAGAAVGAEAGEGTGLLIGAIIFGIAGYWIGSVVEVVLVRVFFVVGSIISILINSAIRRFLWELFTSGS